MSANVGSRARLSYMDVLRGVAIFCVIILHSINLAAMLVGVQVPRFLLDFNAALIPYRMPMLFLLSGMLLSRALAKSPAQYYWGKVRSLLWPYLIWVLIYWLVNWPGEWPGWRDWVGTSWLWFLAYLTAFYLVAPLLVKVPAWCVPVACWAVSHFVPDEQLTLFFLYAGYFFAGNVIWKYRDHGRRFGRLPWVLVGVLATVSLSVGYVLQENGVVFLVPLRREELLYAPLTVIGIGGLVLLARRIPELWTTPVRFLGRNSMVFYLSHFPVQIVLIQVLAAFGVWRWQWYVGLGVLTATLVGIGLVHARRFAVVDAMFVLPRGQPRPAYTAR